MRIYERENRKCSQKTTIKFHSMNQFVLSDASLTWLLKLQALYAGRNGNYIRIEDRIERLRYSVWDKVMTEIMVQIEQQQK